MKGCLSHLTLTSFKTLMNVPTYHITHAQAIILHVTHYDQMCAFNNTDGGPSITLQQLQFLWWIDVNGKQKKVDVI